MTGAPFYKTPRWESEVYLEWVRSQSCWICNSRFRSEAHHRIGHGRCGTVKTDDYEAMPLCKRHHDELHHNTEGGWEAFEAAHRTQHRMIVDTLGQAIRQGVFVLDKKTARGISA